jgi:hypothetical protein
MTPRQIGDSVASKALAGQTLTALRKAAKEAAREAGGSAQRKRAARTRNEAS